MQLKEEVMKSCRDQLDVHIEKLINLNIRKADIEIELIWFIKNKLYKEDLKC